MKRTEKTHVERKKKIESADKVIRREKKATSYDTGKQQTESPQKVRESLESPSMQQRFKKESKIK